MYANQIQILKQKFENSNFVEHPYVKLLYVFVWKVRSQMLVVYFK